MKILQIVTQMEGAGAQRVAYLLRGQLAERGFDASLLFLYVKRSAYPTEPGVSALLHHRPSLLGYLRIVFLLLVRMYVERPDVVITHTHYSNILGQIVAFLSGVRCRIAVNHSPESAYLPSVRFLDKLLGSIGLYSQIVAVSQSVYDSLRKYPGEYLSRIRVIPNGVAVGDQIAGELRTREDWSLPSDVPLLVTVGRLSKTKNHAFLVRLLRFIPRSHLVILGEGEERQVLESLVTELGLERRVHLLGEQPFRTVHAIVAACDLFLFPSTVEAMPMALVEAMLLKRPIIANDIAASRNALGAGGISLSIDDQASWISAIEVLLSDPDRAAALGQAAGQKAEAFSPENMADNYLSLIRNLVGRAT